ncbi:MAG: homocysteine S-methyltransferase family protein [Desulfobacterales bacterium]|nr:homocysteine S-methyltransferase family protein [Desulfobacterales bacterium]
MPHYQNNLPLNGSKVFLTDGGLETTLIFEHHIDLPEFAAFTLFNKENGYQTLRDYYLPYIQVAKKNKNGFILESPTYRASRSWGDKLGYSKNDLKAANQTAISMLEELKFEFEDSDTPMVISGCIGPEGDGYKPTHTLSVEAAKEYHLEQILTFRKSGADLVSAYTINYVEEAVGIALAAKTAKIPAVISFTTETNGTLPSGQSLKSAIERVEQETGQYPIYYMINCAHPTHFSHILTEEPWTKRIQAVRANASDKSHEELDASEELDAGDQAELGRLYQKLKSYLPGLHVFGGCCGTDHTHLETISNAFI